ncbi:cyclase family protein [Maribacter sp. 2307ULW6-5]|uniref:cyclase family protein n=1 Tax=Maribacter sp. 2307ULW6-5 TaxID=3386275 RepID=UPI0039BD68DB
MKATIAHNNRQYEVNLSQPLDISLPLRGSKENVTAWYVGPPKIAPHREDGFVGSVAAGASTNFNDIWFNPHAHGTHTECVGHITEHVVSVNQSLSHYFFMAQLISLEPCSVHGDRVITEEQLRSALGSERPEALVLRTLPNSRDKRSRQYAHTDPPYLSEAAARFLAEMGVGHLLVDLPSVDKEKDGGALLAHRAFWNVGGKVRDRATITEFVFVDSAIADGPYFLNLQLAPFENDASPSRPVLFPVHPV